MSRRPDQYAVVLRLLLDGGTRSAIEVRALLAPTTPLLVVSDVLLDALGKGDAKRIQFVPCLWSATDPWSLTAKGRKACGL